MYSKKFRRSILRGGTRPLSAPFAKVIVPHTMNRSTTRVASTWEKVNPVGNIAIPALRPSAPCAQWLKSLHQWKRFR